MLNDWLQKGDYFSYRNHHSEYQIFYCDSALLTEDCIKPVLVLIHGFPTASIDWQYLWPKLSESFRVITWDMIGFGLSDKPKDYHYCIADQADILQALLQQLAITEYHLCAHDYGDTVAQELLARQSLSPSTATNNVTTHSTAHSTILSTILLNGGLFPETHRPLLMQKLLLSPLGKWLIKFYRYQGFKRTLNSICVKTLADEDLQVYWNLLSLNDGRAVMPKLIRYMQERRRYRERWVNALQQAQGPIRLINGIADPISGAHMIERYRQLMTKPDVIELAGIGHYPQVEAPQSVLSAALAFWRQQGFIH